MPRRPDLFIIGAAKCGTTSMYQYLRGHPQIYMSARKEPRYFAPDVHGGVEGKQLRHGHDLERYLALFEGAGDALRAGEGSTAYLYSHAAPQLLHDFQPQPFLVVMLRDPIDMMRSFHTHRVARGQEPLADFALALAADDQQRAAEQRHIPYRAGARFGEQLGRWLGVFPRDRFRVVILEEFRADPAGEFGRLLEFLGVDQEVQPDFATHNERRSARSRRVQRLAVSRPVQSLVWGLGPRLLGDDRQMALFARLRGVNRAKATESGIDPELRRRLQADFADDVALLSRLLDRDLAELWWAEKS